MSYILPGNSLVFLITSFPIGFIVFISGFHSVFISLSLCVFALCRYTGSRLSALVSAAGSLIVVYAAYGQLPLWSFIILIITVFSTEILSFGLYRLKNSMPDNKRGTLKIARRYKRRDHQLFEPLSLTQRSSPQLFPSKWKTILRNSAPLALIIPFALMPYQSKNNDSVPAVLKSLGNYESISAYHALQSRSRTSILPTFSDIVASIAYQEGIMDGAQFELPVLGTRLQKNRYRQEGDRIVSKATPVVHYDVQWYQKTKNKALSQGIGLLYSTHSGPSPITYANKPVDSVESSSLLLQILIAMMLFFTLNDNRFRYEELVILKNRFFPVITNKKVRTV